METQDAFSFNKPAPLFNYNSTQHPPLFSANSVQPPQNDTPTADQIHKFLAGELDKLRNEVIQEFNKQLDLLKKGLEGINPKSKLKREIIDEVKREINKDVKKELKNALLSASSSLNQSSYSYYS